MGTGCLRFLALCRARLKSSIFAFRLCLFKPRTWRRSGQGLPGPLVGLLSRAHGGTHRPPACLTQPIAARRRSALLKSSTSSLLLLAPLRACRKTTVPLVENESFKRFVGDMVFAMTNSPSAGPSPCSPRAAAGARPRTACAGSEPKPIPNRW